MFVSLVVLFHTVLNSWYFRRHPCAAPCLLICREKHAVHRSGFSLSALIHEHGEVEVARRLAIAGQQGGGLAPVLRGMQDEIQQDVPHDTLTHRTGDDIADRAVQRFLSQGVEISPHLALFYPPALS